ncbi:response regulator transcription factor [Paraburkholderia sp. J94]|uniref:response regulator transcription factor n=1 Tax=Paraburkholderia sp. J94 TaxID=2805441 RepID=UPI002AB0669B|nr:response regulator [Paraburkholderia sp. J94]
MNASAGTFVHVIDDDASIRTALCRVLSHSGFEVREYASAGEFLVSDPRDWTGCLLLDMVLGGPGGLELQQALSRQNMPVPIIFMSAYRDIPLTVKAMKAGAVDFLVKPVERETLLAALETALGQVGQRTSSAHDPVKALGERERYVLRGIASGQRNKQIAAQLGVSERTIKSCRAELMRKFGVESIPALLRCADRSNVIA